MQLHQNKFRFAAGEQTNQSAGGSNNGTLSNATGEKKKEKKKLGFFGRIKKALQEWSNQDQADQEYDDTRV